MHSYERQYRFTPTCVGKASGSSPRAWLPTVHPHVRGEGGSWGLGSDTRTRFTPTCVGKASQFQPIASPASVHPHVRGEGLHHSINADRRHGSPPRAWGRRTPRASRRRRNPVHPHVRGEGKRLLGRHGRNLGSPPRAWGRRNARACGCAERRFTPTCVGKAGRSPAEAPAGTVHPHVRGEGLRFGHGILGAGGSPPRAWGRLGEDALGQSACRFTPTCVGKARNGLRATRQRAVHPHVRGEGDFAIVRFDAISGSPPRAWGRLLIYPKLTY